MFARYLKITVVIAFLAGSIPPGIRAVLADPPAAALALGSAATCPPGLPIVTGSDGTVTCGAAALPDATTSPVQAYDDLRAIDERQGWGLALLALLVIAGKALPVVLPKLETEPGVFGRAATWLDTGYRIVAIASIAAVAAAVYNALALGGSISAAVLAGAAAVFALVSPIGKSR